MSPKSNPASFSSSEEIAHLQLLHLADSALPIGSLAHSFGLETLVSTEILRVPDLPEFLHGYLQEAGMLEAVACREAYQLVRTGGDVQDFHAARWVAINDFLSAVKPARESRAASATLGRNFLHAVMGLGDYPVLQAAYEARHHVRVREIGGDDDEPAPASINAPADLYTDPNAQRPK